MVDGGHESALQRTILGPAPKQLEDPDVVEFGFALWPLGQSGYSFHCMPV
jgi:hypothetical protein